MAGVPSLRLSAAVAALAAYAALVVVITLGYTPDVLGAGPAMIVLLVLPFAIGAAVGRFWVVVAVSGIVLASALVPERTVVESTANSSITTTNSTDLAPAMFFAVIAAMVAYMGASASVKLRSLR